MRRSCRRSVPVCASGGGAGCWASASDTVSTVGTARLNAASPRRESALLREITSDAIFSLIANSSLTSTPLTLRTSLNERQLNKPNQKPRTRFPSHSLTPSMRHNLGLDFWQNKPDEPFSQEIPRRVVARGCAAPGDFRQK